MGSIDDVPLVPVEACAGPCRTAAEVRANTELGSTTHLCTAFLLVPQGKDGRWLTDVYGGAVEKENTT